ncbi:MAG: 2,3-bisphosphoglycerate-independent phosphoglycerate mutase [Acidobacteria bacterium]|nr:2,3-bisphosphoglycerate-independent phosphoglycerate mutase [Acidobacteriota bacterium]MBI3655848.1 2,3-bisphosphoglycerate-independent phosphoglycerate mutase [Acidobacteriota bacterium]
MLPESVIRSLAMKTDSKILLLVMDGLGGFPIFNGQTELEAAQTPNLDALTARSVLGLADPVSPGITPGSGPGHLGIFGYNPLKYEIGRGVLEALGVGLTMTARDVAARGNFVTLDDERQIITDRRAGRIPTEVNQVLCAKLRSAIPRVDGVEIIIEPGREHRFTVLFRGDNLQDRLTDADPQRNGLPPQPTTALDPGSEYASRVINQFIERANAVLKKERPANSVVMRGFAKYPDIPSMTDLFQLRPAAIATYPMYRGLAKLVGMDILATGETIADQIQTLRAHYSQYDFFFFHVKKTDSYGEDGNFEGKVRTIEMVDQAIPDLIQFNPDVLAITGDHSTPSALKAHSWHPVPFLLYSPHCGVDQTQRFTELECARGGLGHIAAADEMVLMLANALKLKKYGA